MSSSSPFSVVESLNQNPVPEVLEAFPQTGVNGWGGVGLRAFFTTRKGGFSSGPYASLNLAAHTGDEPLTVRRNWEHLLTSQGLAPAEHGLVVPQLCHGAALLDADAPHLTLRSGTEFSLAPFDADAVVTRTSGRVVAVTTADCLAALIADPVTRCVAAVHAGWRGTREDILGKTLAHLFAQGWCTPATTYVALGPCLSPAALEVGEDVAASLPAAHVVRLNGRPHFDLRGCNRAQALAAGVAPEAIVERGGCTFSEPDLYFSHRLAQQSAQREGTGTTGRLAACIALL